MMQLDFIIEQLCIQEATNQELMIAKGQWKMLTKRREAKVEILSTGTSTTEPIPFIA